MAFEIPINLGLDEATERLNAWAAEEAAALKLEVDLDTAAAEGDAERLSQLLGDIGDKGAAAGTKAASGFEKLTAFAERGVKISQITGVFDGLKDAAQVLGPVLGDADGNVAKILETSSKLGKLGESLGSTFGPLGALIGGGLGLITGALIEVYNAEDAFYKNARPHFAELTKTIESTKEEVINFSDQVDSLAEKNSFRDSFKALGEGMKSFRGDLEKIDAQLEPLHDEITRAMESRGITDQAEAFKVLREEGGNWASFIRELTIKENERTEFIKNAVEETERLGQVTKDQLGQEATGAITRMLSKVRELDAAENLQKTSTSELKEEYTKLRLELEEATDRTFEYSDAIHSIPIFGDALGPALDSFREKLNQLGITEKEVSDKVEKARTLKTELDKRATESSRHLADAERDLADAQKKELEALQKLNAEALDFLENSEQGDVSTRVQAKLDKMTAEADAAAGSLDALLADATDPEKLAASKAQLDQAQASADFLKEFLSDLPSDMEGLNQKTLELGDALLAELDPVGEVIRGLKKEIRGLGEETLTALVGSLSDVAVAMGAAFATGEKASKAAGAAAKQALGNILQSLSKELIVLAAKEYGLSIASFASANIPGGVLHAAAGTAFVAAAGLTGFAGGALSAAPPSGGGEPAGASGGAGASGSGQGEGGPTILPTLNVYLGPQQGTSLIMGTGESAEATLGQSISRALQAAGNSGPVLVGR